MTGGAFGSMIAQFFHLTAAERKTLLVAGAPAGMSATFAPPVAATLLAVELLLFEWKPRSFVPVALASATAAFLRPYLIGSRPAVPHGRACRHHRARGPCRLRPGRPARRRALRAAHRGRLRRRGRLRERLPIHWMWWPAIGGVVVGVGGSSFPQALGVGYDMIAALLRGESSGNVDRRHPAWSRPFIWAVSLGSGTSGGVLAPLLMMGGALGGLEAVFLPVEAAGFWPLVSMGAILGGTMRSPFTGVDLRARADARPEHAAAAARGAVVAHAFTVLVLRRSILTEKVARRGYHLSREYAIDPLEILFVRDVMRTNVVVLPAEVEASKGAAEVLADGAARQRLYPVADGKRRLLGILNRRGVGEADRRTGHPEPGRSRPAGAGGRPIRTSR